MIRIKSIFFKLFITYITILLVSHFIFVAVYFFLYQEAIVNIHQNDIRQMKTLFALASLISIAISGLITFYLSKRITNPIKEMNRVALSIANGRFNQSIQIQTSDELEELGNSLNFMARELAGIDQMRKDFVANVSHDLRSPLTSIHGFIKAFQDNTIPSEQKSYYLSIMNEQTERMIKLVNDLLDMARLEAGQLEIHPVMFNLSELIRKVIARMDSEIMKKQINVVLLTDEMNDIYVFADPDRIDQVMGNLLLNAIQFSPSGNSVKVIIKKEEKGIVSIRDYGPGISHEEINSIWERFYKVDKARSKKVGTGIGLSIVKHILDLHNSPINVKSELGNGAMFTFTLPLVQENKRKKID